MTIVQGSLCALYMARSGRWGRGMAGGSEIALAIEIRQNIWHSMFATFATWPAADIYATTSALPPPPLPPPPRHNCHLIASFVLFYCHRERERESEGEVEEKKDRANRSQAKHINLTHDLNSDSVFVWRLEASPAHQQNTTQHNRGDTHTHNSLWHSLCLCDKRC